MTKVLLVDDHKLILDSLKLLFNLMEDVDVVHAESDSLKVIPFLEKNEIDVLITDYRMPNLDGVKLTRKVKERFPKIKTLILSVNEDSNDIQDSYNAGASGYVMKKASRKELEEAVRKVAAGDLYFSQDALQSVLSRDSSQEKSIIIDSKISLLTKREIEIVKLLVEEMSSSEIARQLHISTGTVETHRHNILRKLDVKSTVGVIKFALKSGIVG